MSLLIRINCSLEQANSTHSIMGAQSLKDLKAASQDTSASLTFSFTWFLRLAHLLFRNGNFAVQAILLSLMNVLISANDLTSLLLKNNCDKRHAGINGSFI